MTTPPRFVPKTATDTKSGRDEWFRQASSTANQIIGKLGALQPLDDQLTSLAELEYTGNAAKVIAVTAGEDGFELVAQAGGGSGIADGDYGDIVVSGTGTVLTFDTGVVTAFAKTFLDDPDAATVRATIGAAATSHSHAQSDLTGLTTADSPQFAGINLGHAADTTLTRVSAGVVAIEGVNILTTATGATATPSAIFEDQKAANTAGGTPTAGAWTVRPLNTEVYDDIGLTLASNQISLAAGTYQVEAWQTVYRGAVSRGRIRDVTNNVTLALSMNGFASNNTSDGDMVLPIHGRFTLAGTATIELQYRVSNAQATTGLGNLSNYGEVEVYARMKLTKLA